MSKRENVIKLLNKETFDYTPAGFWIHFPKEIIESGIEAQVQAHLQFAEQTQVDVLKIMNENEFRRSTPIVRASDWAHIKPLATNDQKFRNQKEIIERTLEALDEQVYTLGTIHGVMASLSHSSGHSYSHSPQLLIQHALENKTAVLDAIKATTENVLYMLEMTNQTAVDGIYYAQLGAEKDRLPREFFEEFIKPYDLMILKAVQDKKIFLHMCKEHVDFDRFKDYPADVVNWAIHEGDYDLAAGTDYFKDKIILGGLDDRSGVLVDGSKNEIDEALTALKEQSDLSRFILGADCTLPTTINYERIRYAVEHVK
ncbi:uroporphyrinogen decarboxylase family protein [Allofustis seminis]|uniref:uroporphyrinogen decarboxylase family protein n=1 Tax=Allofustis seminis TaxID=166939 RepID=UPI00037027D2|nr:uroporphyrinogen decarboxylase family protein [Allofustis seminis]